MSKVELLSLDGLRVDGRRAKELRQIVCRIGVLPGLADGSAYYEQGNTKCLATVSGPHEPRSSSATDPERLTLDVTLKIATFALGERRLRNPRDRQVQLLEMAATIKNAFAAAIFTEAYPRSQVDIYVQVLQADGGVLAAAVNATTLALIDAGVPMRDYVTACTAGLVENQPICDLQSLEESRNVPYVLCGLLPRTGQIAIASLDQARLHVDRFEELFSAAMEGCRTLRDVLDKHVKATTAERAREALIK